LSVANAKVDSANRVETNAKPPEGRTPTNMVTHSRQGAVDVLSLDSALQEENCDGLRTAAEECVKRGQPRLIIDLGSAAFIDSAGLEALLDINDRCLERGGACKLSAPNALCIDILSATGVDQELEVVDSIVKGAGSFAL